MSETPLKQLTDSNNDNFYPVTSSSGVYRLDGSTVEAALATIPTATSDLENDSNFISEGQANSITGSMIQDNTITSDNIDWTTLMQSGEWVLVDSESLSSNNTGMTFLELAVPTSLQGANVEYKLTIGAEFLASSFPSYPFLNCRKSDGTWGSRDKDFSYIRTAVVGNVPPNTYTANNVNPLAFEWVITSNNCSCTAEVIVGRAGTGSFWNAVGRAGGYSDGGASSVSLASRTNWNTSISGFRIQCSRNITLLNGSHMSLWARKTNVVH